MVGSHSVGKSTLARYVSQTYHLPLLTEVARQILSEQELQMDTLRTDLNVVDDYQMKIFHRQVEQENKYVDFVSDRSFDCLAYAAQHSRTLSKVLKDPILIDYVEKLRKQESIIFFVRPHKAIMREDGVREHLTWDGMIAIDAHVKFLCEMFDLRYFQINTDNMQERIRLVDAVLSLY
jgi:nicotinamide riboside kinase